MPVEVSVASFAGLKHPVAPIVICGIAAALLKESILRTLGFKVRR